MQSPWQQKPIKLWNFIATKWHLSLPRGLKLPWSLGTAHLNTFLVSVWHKWTVSRHEKKFSIHVKMKTNYTVVDAALKRRLGRLNSHGSDEKAEAAMEEHKETEELNVPSSVQNNF